MNRTKIKAVTMVIMVQLAAVAACFHTDRASCPSDYNGCALDHLVNGGSDYPYVRVAKSGESGFTGIIPGEPQCVYVCDSGTTNIAYPSATVDTFSSRCKGTSGTGTGSGS